MNATELADELDACYKEWKEDQLCYWAFDAATMLRQLQAENEALKRQVGGLKISLGNTELLLDESFDRNASHMAGEYVSHQKPVAWMDYLEHSDVYDLNVSGRGIPLYTHPAKTLTDEEIEILASKHLCYQIEGSEVSGVFNFARAILRKAQEK